MRPVMVRKDELLGKIKANRDTHRKVFEEAIVGFRAQVSKELEDTIARLEKGKTTNVVVSRYAPVDHTKDYDNVISMVEMAVGDTIELDVTSHNQYVRDDWTWKRDFVATANYYNSATAAQAYGEIDEEE